MTDRIAEILKNDLGVKESYEQEYRNGAGCKS